MKFAASRADLIRLGVPDVGLQEAGLMEYLQRLIGAPDPLSRLPRRQRQTLPDSDARSSSSVAGLTHGRLPSRLLRRRHQRLLGELPLLTYRTDASLDDENAPPPTQSKGKYEVQLPPKALSAALQHSAAPLPEIDPANLAWQSLAEEADAEKKGNGDRQKQREQ